ncbi:MAG: hypothetical protein K2I53_06395, partial [Lachnospiraceae bacterium]|nr:hypothetical protein [Lachnospiraceae bacterium]
MNKNSKLCWEKTLAVLLAAVIFFSGTDLSVLAMEAGTQNPSQETSIEEESSDEKEPSEEKLPGEEGEKDGTSGEGIDEGLEEDHAPGVGEDKEDNSSAVDDKDKEENEATEEGEDIGEDVSSGDEGREEKPAEDETVPGGGISGNDVEEGSDGDEEELPSVSQNSVSISQNSLTIKAGNSLGSLLLEELQIEAQNMEEEAAAGYAVVDIEVSGTQAEVLLHTMASCMAVVAIYEENSEKPYAFGSAVVEAGENQVVVEIKANSLPQYFEAKGYLVDTDTLRPLSREYNSVMYTRAMQEFLAKTADDFGDATVINLDEDKETNFLVLNDGIFLIREESGQNEGDVPVNRLVSYEEESATYTFANVNDSIKGLKQGGIFLYQYGENKNDFYIIKVEQIELQETDGVTVAIIVASKDELGAEEIFQHVRIDQVSGTAEMGEITQEDCPDGVTYLGRESGAVGYAIEDGTSFHLAKDTWKVGGDKGGDLGSVSGSLKADIKAGFGATITLTYYLDWQLLYTDIKCEVEASVEGEVEASAEVEIPLVTAPLEKKDESKSDLFSISYTPKFVVGGELKGTVKIGISGFLGVKVGAGELEGGDCYGPYNGLALDILQIDAEANVQMGIKFDPQLKVGDVFNAELETGALLGFTAEISNNNSVSTEGSPEEHDCGLQCIAMNGYFDVPLNGELKVLKWKEYDLGEMLDIGSEGNLLKIEFAECYYSIKHQEFGWGKCPYDKRYQKLVLKILDKYGRKGVSGATVQIGEPAAYALEMEGVETQKAAATERQVPVSDSEGVLTMWLPRGKHTLHVTKNGKTTQNKVNVDGEKKLVLHYDYVEEEVYLAKARGAIRRADGSLWTWGTYPGDGTTRNSSPVKVMEDVRDVSISASISAVVTEDGSLWM